MRRADYIKHLGLDIPEYREPDGGTMRDTDTTIPPAVSDFEWRQFKNSGMDQLLPRYFAHCDHANMIAKHNAALSDSDPRKITREWITALRDATIRDAGGDLDQEATERLERMADALASYLQPE